VARRFRLNLVCICLLGLSLVPLVAGSTPAGAQSDILPVDVYLCDRIPDYLPSQGSTRPIPEECVGESGVKITTWTPDGDLLGSCVTRRDGGCGAPSILDAVVVVAEDPATIPDGYKPIRNPDVSWKATEYRASGFVNVPVDTPLGESSEPGEDAATLTIHSRFCPPGFAGPDFYTACDPSPPAYEHAFNLRGPSSRSGWIGADGNVTIEALSAGDYSFVAGLPEATTDVFVYCSLTGDPGVRVPASINLSPYAPSNDYAMRLTLDPDADVLCDFYSIPLPAGAPLPSRRGENFPALVITCGHDPTPLDSPALIPIGCAPVVGASLIAQRLNSTVSDACETRDGGWCELSAFSDEPVVVSLDPAALPPGFVVLRNPIATDVVRGFNGLTFVAVQPIEPSSGAATLTIRARVCPPGFDGTDGYDACQETLPDTLFAVEGLGHEVIAADRPTGGDGNVTFGGLLPGRYEISGGLAVDPVAYYVTCVDGQDPSVEIALDRFGNGSDASVILDLADGDDVICDWYSTFTS
jgi:hypothetical protein